jgi:hypothetical protein
MKLITKNLLRFALAIEVLTIVFRYFLSTGIENQSSFIISTSSIAYFVLMFAFGWYFGKKDGEYLPIYDVGFRFHLTTYIIHNAISLLWIGLGFGSNHEKLSAVGMVTAYWGIGIIIHFIFYLRSRKNSIDQLDKDDLFD